MHRSTAEGKNPNEPVNAKRNPYDSKPRQQGHRQQKEGGKPQINQEGVPHRHKIDVHRLTTDGREFP